MNLARARRLIAALSITADERDELLNCFIPSNQVQAEAYNWRLHLQETRGVDRDDAIRAAIARFKLKNENVDGLRNAVRRPNQTIRNLAKEIRDSESRNQPAKEFLD